MAFFRRKPPSSGDENPYEDQEAWEEETRLFQFYLSTAQAVNVEGGGDFYRVTFPSGRGYPYLIHVSPQGATWLRGRGYSLRELSDEESISLSDVSLTDTMPNEARFKEQGYTDTNPSPAFNVDSEFDQIARDIPPARYAAENPQGRPQPHPMNLPPRGRRGPFNRRGRPKQ